MYSSINRIFNPKPRPPIKELLLDRNSPQDRRVIAENRPTQYSSGSYSPHDIALLTPCLPPTLSQRSDNPDPLIIQEPKEIMNILGAYWSAEAKKFGPTRIDQKCLKHLESFPQFSPTAPPHTTFFNDVHTSLNPLTNTYNKQLFSLPEITTVIRSTKPKRSFGLDLVPAIAIKHLPEDLIQELLALMNNILSNNHYPSIWRTAKTVPIPKKSKPPNKYTSFRPISLLSNVSKIYDALIHKRIQEHISSLGTYPDNQFGFRPAHSTTHAINTLTSHITHHFNATPAIPTGALMIDISRAFDSVWIPGLLYQMHKLHFPVGMLHVLWTVLSNKSFSVHSKESTEPSRIYPLANGLQQGSILAPTLFNIYITPLLNKPSLNSHKAQIIAFADDLLLYTSTPNMQTITSNLQKAIQTVTNYCADWKLQINAEKCDSILFRPTLDKCPNSFKSSWKRLKLTINDAPIPQKNMVKYLGVSLDQHLRYNHHVTTQLQKANTSFRILTRLFRSKALNTRVKTIAYQAFIRPIITYAAPVWFNIPASQMERIRIFERKCLRSSTNLHRVPNDPDKKYYKNTVVYAAAKLERIDLHIIKLIRNHINRSTLVTENSNISAPYLLFDNATIISNGHPPPESFLLMDSLNLVQSPLCLTPIIYHVKRQIGEIALNPVKFLSPESWAYSTACFMKPTSHTASNRNKYWWLNPP